MSNVSDWVKHLREMAKGKGSLKSGDVVIVRQYGGIVVPMKQATSAAAGVRRANTKVRKKVH